ncbi:MAG: hemerythrin, partial [Acidobacteriia bacterium]|nr:hemerythrin [Terriglobia bacterium]
QMVSAAEAAKTGDATAPSRWAEAARAYAGLLRAHINKENNVLFVMAENMLSAEEQSKLAADFDKLEVEKMGEGTHERLHASMDRLLAALR